MKIVVAGAGSIGCFVGGALVQAGHKVAFLARPRIADAVASNGLTLTDFAGLNTTLRDLDFQTDPSVLADADVVLVTVKSAATESIAQLIAQHAPKAAVFSLQNGVTNVAALRKHLPRQKIFATMVPFNVVPAGEAAFHRGTSGDILVQSGSDHALSSAHLVWQSVDNIEAVQWGKLLINLGNAINALSDLPLLDMLHMRAWRRLMADQMAEALRVLKAQGITPAKTTAAPVKLLPHILRLPSPLFKKIAAQMLTIDPKARSSMWDDLTQRRTTEVDALQGLIVEMGQRAGIATPINAALHALIKDAEAEGAGPPGLLAQSIRARIASP
ncbi:2-dehydropantoate 2-reductase [Ascidiaceihabitans sp.]|uniref:2-dehydropantoate 2-reductase n=1 Tax=Ascidiaceihabitans sp. TaxID=1872644 RepID=UPI003296F5C6